MRKIVAVPGQSIFDVSLLFCGDISFAWDIARTNSLPLTATFEKNRKKQYETPYGRFTYRDVPSEAYPFGVILHEENGYGFQIASPEKALCDKLYTISPLKNRAGLARFFAF